MTKDNLVLIFDAERMLLLDTQTITKVPYENSASTPNIPSTLHKEG